MKFTEFELHPDLVSAVDRLGFEECTPIQAATMPHILAGGDMAGLAQTGTGKTAAFLLPLMHRMLCANSLIQEKSESARDDEEEDDGQAQVDTGDTGAEINSDKSAETSDESLDESSEQNPIKSIPFKDWKDSEFILVLVPTRELAEQVNENFKKFAINTKLKSVAVYGGTSYEGQKAAFAKGVQFVFATPGRLIDLYKEHVVDFKQVRAVVFDEADRMFDMGFKDDMRYILRRIPDQRQMLLFSATLNLEVLNIAYEFGANPVEIDVSRDQLTANNVVDHIYHVGQSEKPAMLLSVLTKHKAAQVIIFSNFKANINRVERFLNDNKFPALGISSVLTQGQRNRVMQQFKDEGGSNILVATDVAARGLDVKGVDLVINYELPNDAENYVHRIGRTGRAGEAGHAVSLVSDLDVPSLARIEDYLKKKLEIEWMEDEELVKDFKAFPRSDEWSKKRNDDDRRGGRKKTSGKRGDRKPGSKKSSEHRDRHSKRHRQQSRVYNEEEAAAAGASKKKSGKKTGKKSNKKVYTDGDNRKKGSGKSKSKNYKSKNYKGKSKTQNRDQAASQKSASSSKGIVGKVSGFFKKIFS